MPFLLGAALLSSSLQADDTAASDGIRTVISLDQGWRFQEGWFTLPERTQVSAWRYRLDARGEASADVMAATGLDTSGPVWAEGPKFDARKGQKEESILQGWLAVGDMNRKDDFVSAWFRAELPGGPATRPALEFSRINRIAHVYVNGVKLARREGPEEDFSVDLSKVWKTEGINSVPGSSSAATANQPITGSPVTIPDVDICQGPAGVRYRHQGKANALFLDGHVQSFTKGSILQKNYYTNY